MKIVIMRCIIIAAILCVSVFIRATHAAPSKIHSMIPGPVLQAESQTESSTIAMAQGILNFITDLLSWDGNNINNSGGSLEQTPSSEGGTGSKKDELHNKRIAMSNVLPNMLYNLYSSMIHDAKLLQYEFDSVGKFGWKDSNSGTPQTSTSYPKKAKQYDY